MHNTLENLRAGPLVRTVCSSGVAIWTEWHQHCIVTVTAIPADSQSLQDQKPETCSVTSSTVTVGGRYYALSQLTDLQAATWYNYQLEASTPAGEALALNEAILLKCFRTLDPPAANRTLRLAYGSCRKMSDSAPDALNAFGKWLLDARAERETLWPRLLLLIGDQIYADDPPGSQARSFEDFASQYVEAWTVDAGVRQVLAALPTFMIFDDHEITNNWNLLPTWRAQMLARGEEQMLVDGLVAYWLYQGWGNIGLPGSGENDLLPIMQQAARSGEDILEQLRVRVRQAVSSEQGLQWDYTIPTLPPIFVADVRADRPATLAPTSSVDTDPLRIMSQEQMARLQSWMQEHVAQTTLLVSSVPTLLPPVIGFAEYSMGIRPFQNVFFGGQRRLGKWLALRQQRVVSRMGFEHWPVFNATWRELVTVFAGRERDMIILSGDVHFSYAIAARRTFLPKKGQAVLYQLVASPFRNALQPGESRLIRAQSWIRRAVYGGLYMRILPLSYQQGRKRAPAGLLMQNVISLVTLAPRTSDSEKHAIQQVYLGVVDDTLEEVSTSSLSL